MKKKTKKYQGRDDLSGLMHFISRKFDSVETRFDALEGILRDLQGAVDAYAKRARIFSRNGYVFSSA